MILKVSSILRRSSNTNGNPPTDPAGTGVEGVEQLVFGSGGKLGIPVLSLRHRIGRL